MTASRFCAVAWVAALVVTGAARGELIGVGWDLTDSPVYRIDERTGSATLIGRSGVGRLNSLAAAPDGSLYSVGGGATENDPPDLLVRIEPDTGLAVPVRTLSMAGRTTNVRALAFAPDGTLYAVNATTAVRFELFRVDLATGAGIRVGEMIEGVQGIDFAPDGTLYGFNVYQSFFPFDIGLVRIDPATGATTDVNPATRGANIQSIVFAADGTLYAARNDLWRIDPATDTRVLVGHLGELELRGIEVVPEPAGCMAVAAAAVAFLRRRGRGRRRQSATH